MEVKKISQTQVLDFLEANKGKWFTARELSKKIGITQGSCTNNLYRLIKHQLIIRREASKRYTFEYKYKKNILENKPLSSKGKKERDKYLKEELKKDEENFEYPEY